MSCDTWVCRRACRVTFGSLSRASEAAAANDVRLVDAEIARLRDVLTEAECARGAAVAAVVAPAGASLVAQYHSLRDQAEMLGETIAALPDGAVKTFWASRPALYRPNCQLAEIWRAAAAALETDANAELPDVGSLCALGGFVPFPVTSAITHFPEDFGGAALSAAAE